MNEFLPRTEPVASVVSATERKRLGIRAESPIAGTTTRTDATAGSTPPRSAASEEAAALASANDEQARTAALYARVQSGIGKVVADLGSGSPKTAAMLNKAEASVLDLMPQPAVVVLLPPASEDMVQFVAQVTQSIARQAAQARAAQANASPYVVDAATG